MESLCYCLCTGHAFVGWILDGSGNTMNGLYTIEVRSSLESCERNLISSRDQKSLQSTIEWTTISEPLCFRFIRMHAWSAASLEAQD